MVCEKCKKKAYKKPKAPPKKPKAKVPAKKSKFPTASEPGRIMMQTGKK